MFNRPFFAGAAGSSLAVPSLLQPHEPQRVVRDVVKMPPVRDEYAELRKASERLSAGKSILPEAEAPKKAAAE